MRTERKEDERGSEQQLGTIFKRCKMKREGREKGKRSIICSER